MRTRQTAEPPDESEPDERLLEALPMARARTAGWGAVRCGGTSTGSGGVLAEQCGRSLGLDQCERRRLQPTPTPLRYCGEPNGLL